MTIERIREILAVQSARAHLTHGFSLEDVAKAERRAASPGPWHSTREVLEYLHIAADDRVTDPVQ